MYCESYLLLYLVDSLVWSQVPWFSGDLLTIGNKANNNSDYGK